MTPTSPPLARCPVRSSPRRPALLRGTCVAAAWLLLAGPAAAAMYKWTDANGSVVYSDHPPPGNIKSEVVNTPPAPANPNAAKDLASKESELRKRQLERTEAAQKAEQTRADADKRQAACVQARGRLKVLVEEQAALYAVNERGERVYMDSATRRKEVELQEKWLRENCGS